MLVPRLKTLSKLMELNKASTRNQLRVPKRNATTTQTGAILPEPERTPYGILGIICTVIPGLFVGAAISKIMANFLEENELFVPSDDDDDDD